MITMLLGGLWHGANWTFVVWGALHGFYLWVEKIFQDIPKKFIKTNQESDNSGTLPQQNMTSQLLKKKSFRNFILALLTFFLINVTWVFFRAPDFTSAWRMLTAMFSYDSKGEALLTSLSILKVSVVIICMVTFHWLMRNTRVLDVANKMSWWVLGIIWSAMIVLLLLSQESGNSFIYFQF